MWGDYGMKPFWHKMSLWHSLLVASYDRILGNTPASCFSVKDAMADGINTRVERVIPMVMEWALSSQIKQTIIGWLKTKVTLKSTRACAFDPTIVVAHQPCAQSTTCPRFSLPLQATIIGIKFML